MDVVFAESIRSFIEEYEIALMKYPISRDRALQKKQEMIDFFYKKLPSVGRYTLRTCPYRRLGQILRNGQPQLPYLLMGSYQDKSSRTTWLFSCIMDDDTDTLTICHILHSNGVYESKTTNRISITESDIRKMVRECLHRIKNEVNLFEAKNPSLTKPDKQIPNILYHVSNPYFRKHILAQGLKPMVGSSYRAHFDDIDGLIPVIFLKDKNDYDSTYNDDRWAIDTSTLDKSCIFADFDDYMAKCGCYVYTKTIAPDSMHLLHKGDGQPLNESSEDSNLFYDVGVDDIKFKNGKGVIVGEVCYNVSNIDGIYSEYDDTIEDFDHSIMRKFDYNFPIVNIEDIWVYREYRGNGLFRKMIEIAMTVLGNKYRQFILRACSDNGFPEQKLVSIYEEFGFIPYQETEQDGTIMYLKK